MAEVDKRLYVLSDISLFIHMLAD